MKLYTCHKDLSQDTKGSQLGPLYREEFGDAELGTVGRCSLKLPRHYTSVPSAWRAGPPNRLTIFEGGLCFPAHCLPLLSSRAQVLCDVLILLLEHG